MGIATDFLKEWEEYQPKLQKELPQVVAAATNLRNETYQDGALSHQVKVLIALAIGISIPCEACIISHVNKALKAQATKEQILETLAVAIQMRGGPAIGESRKVLQALEELTASEEHK